MDGLIAPLLQRKLSAPEAVNVAVSPAQIFALFTETVGVGRRVTSVLTAAAEQPFVVPVTVYVVFELGETSILEVVAPLLQRKLSAPKAVKVTVSPAQMLALFTDTFGTSVTVTFAVTGAASYPAVFPITV